MWINPSEIDHWITVEGSSVPVKKGQSDEEAGKAFIEEKENKKKNAQSQGKDRKSLAKKEDITTIKEQVAQSSYKLKNTKVLAFIPKGKMTTDFKTAAKALKDELEDNGGVVTREGFGDIQVGLRLKKAHAYIKSAAEIAALSAVPTIIEKGVQIASHEKHKGRDYSTVTFAGKIKIAGENCVLAVIVEETNEKKYKVHRVLTFDGKTFK